MFCPKCGEQVYDNSKTCPFCACNFAAFEKQRAANVAAYKKARNSSANNFQVGNTSTVNRNIPQRNNSVKKPAKKKMSTMTEFCLAALSSAIILLFIFRSGSNDNSTVSRSTDSPDVTVEQSTEIVESIKERIVPFDQLFIDEKYYDADDLELETTVCVEEISNFYFKATAEENEYNGWGLNDCDISFENIDNLSLLNVGDYVTVYGIYSGGASESIKQAKIIYSGTEALQRFEEEKQLFNEWLDKTYSNRNSVLINDIDTFEFDYLTDDPKYEKVLATDIIKMCETDSENAQNLYSDKFLEIKGRVYRNGVSGDQLEIRGSDNHFHLPVICSPRNDTQKLWIMNLKEGDNVIVRCEVSSVSGFLSAGSIEANIDDIFTCDGRMSDEMNTVLISYGELGQCGQIDYFDFDPMIRYYLPAGKYSATCTGTQKGTGFFIESVKSHKEDGYETPDVYEEYHFDEKPSVTFELKDDRCIYVFSGTHMEVKEVK